MNLLNKNNILIAIIGPTASGKTTVAATLAAKLNGEIISADSRQIYREMNLGTGKDYDDYCINGIMIPYHLIDIKEPGYQYNLYEYQQDFYTVYYDVIKRNKTPILCGGTGLYIEAATQNYMMMAVPPDPLLRSDLEKKEMKELITILSSYKRLHNQTDIDTKKRAIRAIEIEKFQEANKNTTNYQKIQPLYFGIKYDRSSQRQRITARLHQRLENGMVDEVQRLLDKGLPPENLLYYGLEYKYITLFLTGKLHYDEMVEKLNTAIHQFAKRQMTWFRRMERQGNQIYWFDGYEPLDKKIKRMTEILRQLHYIEF